MIKKWFTKIFISPAWIIFPVLGPMVFLWMIVAETRWQNATWYNTAYKSWLTLAYILGYGLYALIIYWIAI